MSSEFERSEWTLPLFGAGTVLALAKHINPRSNSGVSYRDLANTIDSEQGLIAGCGADGGQLGVIVNAEDPAYLTPEYLASGRKPADIIIKLVRDPNSSP
ncbi:hypothetical protein F5Y10DRAFT_252118 [Nemania abortiva]|nr:hypothetical protein F5Y10DRAFT_252118 [Nemania abortiva]